jgi:putative transposase
MKDTIALLEPDGIYHVYNRANGFENLFHHDENYRFFLQQWDKYISPIADTLCYCLMPNHIHFIIKNRSEGEVRRYFKFEDDTLTFGKFQTFQKFLSKQFANLFSSYTQAFNKMHNRHGSLFSPNFKRKIIDDDFYLINLIYYIHRNPVHHGFCSDFKDWKHSSFHRLVSDDSGFLNKQAVFEYFSDKQNFIDSHEDMISLKEEYSLE